MNNIANAIQTLILNKRKEAKEELRNRDYHQQKADELEREADTLELELASIQSLAKADVKDTGQSS